MKLKVLGSGSRGNCYLFQPSAGPTLMVEAGVPFKDVISAMKGNISSIGACIITHEHKDHAGHAREVLDKGIPVYATPGTKEAVERHKGMAGALSDIRPFLLIYDEAKAIPPQCRWYAMSVGGFYIRPFATVHDAEDPCGFVLYHHEMGGVIFATDTAYIPNTFTGIDNILIECNYDAEMLEGREDIPDTLKERIRGSHMSLDTCIAALKVNDLDTVKKIILIHVSGSDGDAERFREKVEAETGCHTLAAEPGMEIELSAHPF